MLKVLLNWFMQLSLWFLQLIKSSTTRYRRKKLVKNVVLRRPDAWQQRAVYSWAMALQSVTIARRHSMTTPVDLYNLDRSVPENQKTYRLDSSVACYGCNQLFRACHPVYFFSCQKCGDKFQKLRTLTHKLTGKISLVVGARTKLGHQVVVKLLDADATVVGTTRYPDKALELFAQYPKWKEWKSRLYFFPKPLDLDSINLSETLCELRDFVLLHSSHVDILINSAAQTIRSREKMSSLLKEPLTHESNRYGGNKFVPDGVSNSWHQRLADIRQYEMEEVYRVNAIAPALMIQTFMPLLQACLSNPYVINVHARECLFHVDKDDRHVHTNMAKAALGMLTRCLAGSSYQTTAGAKIWFHGIDPGWMSIDEYYKSSSPVIIPPLDEVDGASRVLYPIMANVQGSFKSTRRHFQYFKT